jgi:hypothetical protein
MTTVDQLKPVLKEFIASRRRVKGIVGIKDDDDDDAKSVSAASQRTLEWARASQAGDDEGEESQDDDDLVFVETEEPRDQWDCESITSTQLHSLFCLLRACTHSRTQLRYT